MYHKQCNNIGIIDASLFPNPLWCAYQWPLPVIGTTDHHHRVTAPYIAHVPLMTPVPPFRSAHASLLIPVHYDYWDVFFLFNLFYCCLVNNVVIGV